MSDDILSAEVEIGESLKRFLQTDEGRYLDGLSKQDVEEAKDALLDLDPYAYDSLTALQNEIAKIQRDARIARSIVSYISRAIQAGEQALSVLTGENEED